MIWEDEESGTEEIFYRWSTDGGATFGTTENLSMNAGALQRPDVAASGNNVYVVWNDTTPGNSEIFYRRSADNGVNFDNTISLSHDPAISPISEVPAIAASGNNIYVLWQARPVSTGINEIFSIRSTDAGADFGPTAKLKIINDVAGVHSFRPSIAIS